ncbi:gas vesicle protein K [Pseudalkalibacillus hwajinpoensis]|uniref:Gas vesicle protein K n=1 Tax=Guptibacillus hwajinpoensis TaxID=208199 RepID=A0A4U1MJJ8_9BACL|nr:gas vesicle protein K [Pseudalkalibacillus hwajinpoensis]TKD70686.1 gas vesicle protein K [Pseudalkalibacillus hwajinpoensis]
MQQANQTSGRINFDPDKAEQGLAQLVLTVVELLRQIVERHAMRRVEGGTLTDDQVENLGVALMNLEEKMEELKDVFGLDAEDLNIDLGPLGSLL